MAAREWGADAITVNAICPIALTDATREALGQEDPGPLPQMALKRMGLPDKDIGSPGNVPHERGGLVSDGIHVQS